MVSMESSFHPSGRLLLCVAGLAGDVVPSARGRFTHAAVLDVPVAIFVGRGAVAPWIAAHQARLGEASGNLRRTDPIAHACSDADFLKPPLTTYAGGYCLLLPHELGGYKH